MMEASNVLYEFGARIVSGSGAATKVDPRPGMATIMDDGQYISLVWRPLNSHTAEEEFLLKPSDVKCTLSQGPDSCRLLRFLYKKTKIERHLSVEQSLCCEIHAKIATLLGDDAAAMSGMDNEANLLCVDSTAKSGMNTEASKGSGFSTHTKKHSSKHSTKHSLKDKEKLKFFNSAISSVPPAYCCIEKDEEFNRILGEVEAEGFSSISIREEMKKPSATDQRLDKLSDGQLLGAAAKMVANRRRSHKGDSTSNTLEDEVVKEERQYLDEQDGSFSQEISPELLIPILSYIAVQDIVYRYVVIDKDAVLPETEKELISSVGTTTYKEIEKQFLNALASCCLGPIFKDLPVSEEVRQAANSGDVQCFVKVLISEKESYRNPGLADEGDINLAFAGETQL